MVSWLRWMFTLPFVNMIRRWILIMHSSFLLQVPNDETISSKIVRNPTPSLWIWSWHSDTMHTHLPVLACYGEKLVVIPWDYASDPCNSYLVVKSECLLSRDNKAEREGRRVGECNRSYLLWLRLSVVLFLSCSDGEVGWVSRTWQRNYQWIVAKVGHSLHHLHSTDLTAWQHTALPSTHLLLYKAFALLWAQRRLIIPHRKPARYNTAPRTQRLFIPQAALQLSGTDNLNRALPENLRLSRSTIKTFSLPWLLSLFTRLYFIIFNYIKN